MTKENTSKRNIKIFEGLPNKLTLSRIATAPVVLLLYPIGGYYTQLFCSLLFLLASITDFFDGYIARRLKQTSPVGATLDHLADKLLSSVGLVVILNSNLVPAFFAGLLLCRDMTITGLRLIASEQRISIAVNSFGKAKTLCQSAAIVLILIPREGLNPIFKSAGMLAFWAAVLLSTYSAYLYFCSYFEQVQEKEQA